MPGIFEYLSALNRKGPGMPTVVKILAAAVYDFQVFLKRVNI